MGDVQETNSHAAPLAPDFRFPSGLRHLDRDLRALRALILRIRTDCSKRERCGDDEGSEGEANGMTGGGRQVFDRVHGGSPCENLHQALRYVLEMQRHPKRLQRLIVRKKRFGDGRKTWLAKGPPTPR